LYAPNLTALAKEQLLVYKGTVEKIICEKFEICVAKKYSKFNKVKTKF